MIRIYPTLIVAFIGMVSAFLWKARELGWYAGGAGIRMVALAPFSRTPQLVANDVPSFEPCPTQRSELNRAHSWMLVLVGVFVPFAVVTAMVPDYPYPWTLLHQQLRASPLMPCVESRLTRRAVDCRPSALPHQLERSCAYLARLAVAPVNEVIKLKIPRFARRIDEIAQSGAPSENGFG